jgi:hypothetical protein
MCQLEGICFNYRCLRDIVIAENGGEGGEGEGGGGRGEQGIGRQRDVRPLRAVGGGSKSGIWMQA